MSMSVLALCVYQNTLLLTLAYTQPDHGELNALRLSAFGRTGSMETRCGAVGSQWRNPGEM